MDGLERIIEKIEADAEASASAAVTEAEKKASEIVAKAEADGASEAADMIAAAKAECEAMIKKAHSGGELLRRKTLLSRKVEIIDGTITKAIGNFVREDTSKYFDAMIRLAAKYSFDGEQKMIFSDKDVARMPADFADRVNKTVGGKAKITVSGGGGFDGGFLLISGDTAENCTVSALLSEAETEIRDELNKILFG